MSTLTTATLGRLPATLPRNISVLGATGSVGRSTLDLIGRNPDDYRVVALSANCDAEGLAELAIRHNAEVAVVADHSAYTTLKNALSGTQTKVASGEDALAQAAGRPADWIMGAIMGAAGLRPTFAAVEQGTHLALANKECLVSAGEIFMNTVSRAGCTLLPVDSEHSAAFQALHQQDASGIERITLTGSGGPFRTWSLEQMSSARPDDALNHPTWSMGRKISIDSATLMNKGLELIEAFHLFPVQLDQLDLVIHPQSIIHCLVEYTDGSVLAQMSAPDMRTPIAFSLSYPERMHAPTQRLNLAEISTLSFEYVDELRFPAIGLAREALASGPCAPVILNAANEVAVDAFLGQKTDFLSITKIVEATLEASTRESLSEPENLDDILTLDEFGRTLAYNALKNI